MIKVQTLNMQLKQKIKLKLSSHINATQRITFGTSSEDKSDCQKPYNPWIQICSLV